MTLSEDLAWRGLISQTTLDDAKDLDEHQYCFYFGVDPSADSMTVGHLAIIMLVRRLIDHGHKAVLLVGGATGMIGDPDGKATERDLISFKDLTLNKRMITRQFKRLFAGRRYSIVDNYDWFKDVRYLDFLRQVGKNVPLRQMLNREFVSTRMQEEGNGISYAEFSYVLIQAYDFYQLNIHHGVNLQVCGSDQWGNSVAGVDLTRRLTGKRVDVFSSPLIVNPVTGIKFGKTESGAIWLDASKTSPTAFYQFWVNSEDEAVENYLKVYTEMSREQIDAVLAEQRAFPKERRAQFALADQITSLVHGADAAVLAKNVTRYLRGLKTLEDIGREELTALRREIPSIKLKSNEGLDTALVSSGLAGSLREARQLISEGAVYVNHHKTERVNLLASDFIHRRALIRRGKAFKDSGLIELVR